MLLLCVCCSSFAWARDRDEVPKTYAFQSPNRTVEVDFEIEPQAGAYGFPIYRLAFKGKRLVQKSRLGLQLQDFDLSSNLRVISVERNSQKNTYALPVGKASTATDFHVDYAVTLEQAGPLPHRLKIIFRLFDDGAAIQYNIPKQAGIDAVKVKHENTELVLAGNPKLYGLPMDFASAYESKYKSGTVDSFEPGVHLGLPAALAFPGAYLYFTEAQLHHNANLYVHRAADSANKLEAEFPPNINKENIASEGELPYESPWRVFLLGDSPAEILESNIITSLSLPSRIADTDWIKPGKVLFPWWNGYVVPGAKLERADHPEDILNEKTLKHYIDFCADHGIPYFSVDGYEFIKAWYGGKIMPFDPNTQDMTRPLPEVNLPEVLRYGKAKGIEARIWLNSEGLNPQNVDPIFSVYHDWGVTSIMVDFLGDDSQHGVEFLDLLLKTAQRLHLMVAFHGVAKPTGLNRTYPNLLTEEGVLGEEYNKWEGPNSTPDHEVLVGLIRGAVGPLDTHEGSFRPVPMRAFKAKAIAPNTMGTLARQLAMYVVYENEQPMLADYPEAYEKHLDAFKFIQEVPVTWDQTKIIDADLEKQSLIVARRKVNDWYLGGITNQTARNFKVPLSFLGRGRFVAYTYADAPGSEADGEKIELHKAIVTAHDSLSLKMSAAGGVAIQFLRLVRE